MQTLRNAFSAALRFLRSRLFRNLFFWAFIIYNAISITPDEHKRPAAAYYLFIAATSLIFAATLYANNLWLVPRYLSRRRYRVYFPAIIAVTGVASVVHTIAFKAALGRFPVDEIQQVLFVYSPVSTDWNINSILSESASYWGGFLLWVGVFTAAWFAGDYARQARIAREARARQAELELSALKHQLHPHFLFNTLNNLYGLASASSPKTPRAILQLSELLRYLLYDSAAHTVSFKAEKQAVQSYTHLERLRLEDSAVIDVRTEGPDDMQLPPLLWLPVLENAFKHGTRFIGGPYEIHFRMEFSDSTLRIDCRNRYKPGATDTDAAQGIGLPNLRKRLALLFPGRHELHTEVGAEWYHLRLTATLSAA